MASLSGATIATTFKSLLKLAGNTDDLVAGAIGAAKQVMTGDGENTPIYLNTDRVGIGTAAPASALDIESTTDGNYAARIKQDHATGWGVVIDNKGTTTGDPILSLTSNNGSNQVFWADSDSKVGIGTVAPTSTFVVNGNARFGDDDAILNTMPTTLKCLEHLDSDSHGAGGWSQFIMSTEHNSVTPGLIMTADTTYSSAFIVKIVAMSRANGLLSLGQAGCTFTNAVGWVWDTIVYAGAGDHAATDFGSASLDAYTTFSVGGGTGVGATATIEIKAYSEIDTMYLFDVYHWTDQAAGGITFSRGASNVV